MFLHLEESSGETPEKRFLEIPSCRGGVIVDPRLQEWTKRMLEGRRGKRT